MYAVVKTGGHQYRVSQGDILDVEKIPGVVGDQIELSDVLMTANEDEVQIGTPILENAKVMARVLNHPLDKKLIVAKFKKRKRYRRKGGHRQEMTRLRIEEIIL